MFEHIKYGNTDPSFRKEKIIMYNWMKEFDKEGKYVYFKKPTQKEILNMLNKRRYLREVERQELNSFLKVVENNKSIMIDKKKGSLLTALNVLTFETHPSTLISHAEWLEKKYPIKVVLTPLMRRIGMKLLRAIKFKVVFKQKSREIFRNLD